MAEGDDPAFLVVKTLIIDCTVTANRRLTARTRTRCRLFRRGCR